MFEQVVKRLARWAHYASCTRLMYDASVSRRNGLSGKIVRAADERRVRASF